MSETKGIAVVAGKVSLAVDRAVSLLCAVLFGSMTLAVLLGVFFRYVLNAPLSWTEEVSRYLMIWGASTAICLGIRAGEHVGLTVLLDSLKSARTRAALQSLIFLLVLAFLALMFFFSIRTVTDAKFMRTQALGISMVLPYLALPVSMGLATVQLVLSFIVMMAGGRGLYGSPTPEEER